MKKIVSLLLAVMMVLSLAACGGNETATDNDNGTSTPQNQTDVTDTSSTEQSTDTSSSTTDNIGGSDSADVPSSTISKPTTTTKPETSKPTTTTKPETTKPSTPTHTHSYSAATCTEAKKCSRCGATDGSALGHNWQDATCQAPKTCSVCKATEGHKVEHVVSGDTCKWCMQVIAVDPKGFDASIPYSCISKRYSGEIFYYPNNFDCYIFTLIDFNGQSHSEAVHDARQCPYGKDGHRHVHHNGNYYDNIAQADGLYGKTTYNITDSEIIASVPVLSKTLEGKAEIHFGLLSNGTLKVLSISGTVIPDIAGISVGTIFYPNLNYEISYN